MAAKHLRRLRGDAPDLPALPSSESEASSDGESSKRPGRRSSGFNPYEYLAMLEAEDAENESDQGGSDEESAENTKTTKPETSHQMKKHPEGKNEGTITTTKKKRNRKKKKKKGKEEASASSKGEDLDDIDKLVKELNLETVGKSPCAAPPIAEESKSHVLGVTSRSLRADEELYRIFGAQVVASEEAQMRKENDKRYAGRNPKGVRGLKKAAKSCWLVDVQEHWPPRDGGLGMEYEGLKDGCYWFRYTYSSNYSETQLAFEEAQGSGDPNVIAALLQRNPWHVDALLAMYSFYRATGDHLYGEEMLNRCLFALESAWHPFFTPTLGTCRFDIKIPENKALFQALFHHIQGLNRRGCMDTALECCKLLLSLDSGDPMGALCFIDYLAIRAGRFDFLQRLVDELDDGSSLALMPGIAYSIALSKLKSLADESDPGAASTSASGSRPAPDGGAGGAASDGEDCDKPHDLRGEAKEALVQAILLYPLVVVRLVGKLKEDGVAVDAQFSSTLERKIFSRADDGGSASLGHLVNIFVERHHLLWKPSEVIKWLKECCMLAADALDEGDSVGGVTAADWACVRSQAFPPTTVNEYRHLHLYDFTDDHAQLPAEALQGAMGGGDMEGAFADLEDRMAQALQQHGDQRGVLRLTEDDLQNGNPLLVFLRSMLPWVQAPNPDPDPPPPPPG